MIWINELAAISASEHAIIRLPLTPEAERAKRRIASWMQEAGMSVTIDTADNVIGRYEAETPGAPALMIGSHTDTVIDAGKFDGCLGVIAAIACVRQFHLAGQRFPFAIEVVAFSDEEGVRWSAGMMGSGAMSGVVHRDRLSLRDADGVALGEAMELYGLDPDKLEQARRQRDEILAYIELHIEQGPVLESENLALGCVTAIAGASRLTVEITGMAGHAGTVPMHLRRDALTAAAECILAIEKIGHDNDMVCTVGRIIAEPGAGNVIPGSARFSVDLRTQDDMVQELALAELRSRLADIAKRRNVEVKIHKHGGRNRLQCAEWLQHQICNAIETVQPKAFLLASGAGHDGISMSRLTDIGMMFVRCRGGISHHPDEHVDLRDIASSITALSAFIKAFAPA